MEVIEVEKRVLGGLIDNNKAIPQTLSTLQTQDFYLKSHQVIYEGIKDLYQKGDPIELLSLTEHLKDEEVLTNIGGAAYLAELLSNQATTPQGVYYYAELIKEYSDKRKINSWLEKAAKKVEENTPILEILTELQGRIQEMQVEKGKEIIPELDIEGYKDWLTRLGSGELTGFDTGLPHLNMQTQGLAGLWVIGAGPKMHKSTLALQIATHIAEHGNSVVYYDLENGEKRLLMRLHSRYSELSFERLRKARSNNEEITGPEMEAYNKGLERIYDLRSYFTLVTDRSKVNLPMIEAQIRTIQEVRKTERILLVFDSLQKLHSTQKERRLQIDEWLRNFEKLKNQFDCSILVISELRRNDNDYSSVTIQDFKESGDIEYTAETLIGINKPDKGENKYKLIVLASRDGQSGPVEASYIPHNTLWYIEERR